VLIPLDVAREWFKRCSSSEASNLALKLQHRDLHAHPRNHGRSHRNDAGQTVAASEKPMALRHMSCTLVRLYVAKYSESAAEAWARSKGATDAEIETARRCLPASAVQTAGFMK
jgi:hypothetical protein